MKKIFISAFLLAALLLSSCGETVELMDFIGADTDGVDYGGYNCLFIHGDNNFEDDKGILTYDKNTLQGEALLKRIDDIKQNINVNLVINYEYDEESYQLQAISGGMKADIISLYYMNAMQVLASGGFLLPINEFSEYIDLNDAEKYGSSAVIEPGMVDSVPYAVQPVSWPGYHPTENFLVVYNTDIHKANGITDFHEFYENKNWTWDTFENEYLKKFNVKKSEEVFPAISSKEAEFFDMMIYSNGVQYVTRNAAGENVPNPYPAEFVKAYDTMLRWCSEYENIDLDNNWVNPQKFIYGNSAAVIAQGVTVAQGVIAYMESSFGYGIMPFPSGPDSVYGRWANFIMSMKGIGIAAVSEEPDIAAHTISLLCEPFEDFGGRGGLFDYYSQNVFLSDVDAEIFFDVGRYARYDYTFWNQRDVGRDVAFEFGKSAENGISFAEASEKYYNFIQELVYEYILPNFDYMYENYYSRFED